MASGGVSPASGGREPPGPSVRRAGGVSPPVRRRNSGSDGPGGSRPPLATSGKGRRVADSFLRRWFGPQAAPPSVEEARAELDRLAADRPAFLPLFLWLRELLPDLSPADPPAALPLD